MLNQKNEINLCTGRRSLRSCAIQGMSLIEVLIALLVLSIGLAGMAALHLNSLTSVHSAHYRSLASTIALDFEERLWLAIADNSIVDVDTGYGPGCPDIDSVLTDMQTHWSQATLDGTSSLRLPNMTIVAEPLVASSPADTAQLPIVVSWDETRLENVDDDRESFRYMARVLCRTSS